MSHEHESSASRNVQAWHGLANVVTDDQCKEVQSFLTASGLDWQTDLQPMYTEIGGQQTLIDTHRAVVRQSDNAVLGVVGNRYTPLQNVQAFEWFQPFLDTGEVIFETAGSLKGGRVVWVLANIQGQQDIGGDKVNQYLLLSNSHDGSLSVRVQFTPVRVVCWNTLGMAHRGNNATIKLRHCQSLHRSLDEVRETLDLVRQTFAMTAEQYRVIARAACNLDQVRQYVTKVVINPTEGEDLSTRQANIVDRLMEIYETGRGANLPETYWRAYNAVAEYWQHDYGRNADNRVHSLWFGQNHGQNVRALEMAVAAAS